MKPFVWLMLSAGLLVSLGIRGPILFKGLTPDRGIYLDFVQEWLSARSYWHGQPVYRPQLPALAEYTGIPEEQLRLRLTWNAHPPGAVVLGLPFGLFTDYYEAHLAWSLFSIILMITTVAFIIHELQIDFRPAMMIATIAMLWSDPLYINLHYGQLGGPLVLLLTLAWRADRRAQPILAGIYAGLAITLKLFPGLILVYFLCTRRWKGMISTGLSCLAGGMICLLILGLSALETYVRDVLPSLNQFRGEWINLSIAEGFQRGTMLLGVHPVSTLITFLFRLTVLGLIAYRCWAARTACDHDRAFALTILGMLLLSPVVWTHYLVLLAFPFFLLLHSPERILGLAVLVILNMPLLVPAALLMTEAEMDLLSDEPTRLTLKGTLAIIPYQAALLGLFACLIRRPSRVNPASSS